MGSNHTVNFSKGTWHHRKILERKGPSRGVIPKCDPCAPRVGERTQDETLDQERCAHRVPWNLAKNVYELKNTGEASFYSPFEARATAAPTSKSPEEREFVVDTGASMHTLSKQDESSDEMETLRRSTNATTVVAANGEVQTSEEAPENVHDLDLFVTVQILNDVPAVLPLGELCEEHGYTYEWTSGLQPHLTEQGKKIQRKTENIVPPVVPGLSSNSGIRSSSASLPQDLSSTPSGPETERSDDSGTRKLARFTKNPKQK